MWLLGAGFEPAAGDNRLVLVPGHSQCELKHRTNVWSLDLQAWNETGRRGHPKQYRRAIRFGAREAKPLPEDPIIVTLSLWNGRKHALNFPQEGIWRERFLQERRGVLQDTTPHNR